VIGPEVEVDPSVVVLAVLVVVVPLVVSLDPDSSISTRGEQAAIAKKRIARLIATTRAACMLRPSL